MTQMATRTEWKSEQKRALQKAQSVLQIHATPCHIIEDPTVLKVLVLMEDDLWSLEQAPIGRSHVTKTMQSTEENYTSFAK